MEKPSYVLTGTQRVSAAHLHGMSWGDSMALSLPLSSWSEKVMHVQRLKQVTWGSKMSLPLGKYSNNYENFCKHFKKQPHQEELIEKEKILVGFLNKLLTYSTL